jgi:DNA recombination protein RmuC
VILGNLLEQTLAPDHYEANVPTTGTAERVEYAVKVPQRDREGWVWLPIDSKFPKEDYERIMAAQEAGDPVGAEAARDALDARIKAFGKDICSKYLAPGKTTDWAVMFLPSEGLYAEVLRRTQLVQSLHRDCKVMLAGPTTLWAVLTGFLAVQRGHAIEKRAGEVTQLLTAVNGEFNLFSEAVKKIQKKLQEASNSAKKLQTRSNVLGRELKKVEKIESVDGEAVVALPPPPAERLALEDDTVGTPGSN